MSGPTTVSVSPLCVLDVTLRFYPDSDCASSYKVKWTNGTSECATSKGGHRFDDMEAMDVQMMKLKRNKACFPAGSLRLSR